MGEAVWASGTYVWTWDGSFWEYGLAYTYWGGLVSTWIWAGWQWVPGTFVYESGSWEWNYVGGGWAADGGCWVWGWDYESGWWHLIYVTDHCPTAGTGDMNADDTLDVLDLVAIVYGIVEQTFEEGSCEMKTADSNEDGDVNVIDLVEYVGVIIA